MGAAQSEVPGDQVFGRSRLKSAPRRTLLFFDQNDDQRDDQPGSDGAGKHVREPVAPPRTCPLALYENIGRLLICQHLECESLKKRSARCQANSLRCEYPYDLGLFIAFFTSTCILVYNSR